MAELLFREMPILWLVDEAGAIVFALEEVVSVDTGSVQYPRFRKLRVNDPYGKLGHPALVGSPFRARIGGELFYDPGPGFACWVLTNRSGRYGINLGRTPRQLENVATVFQAHGIQARPYFIPQE